MSRHRILIVGAPASGKGWLAGRIRSLTGMASGDDLAAPALAERHEWIVVARDRARTTELLELADLVVIVRTPPLMRSARLLRRWLASRGRPGLRGLRKALVETRRWEADEVPALRELLQPHRERVLHCGSPDQVRAVLECVLGLPPTQSART